MSVNASSSESFFDTYNKYTKDGKITTDEYQNLKKLYIEENNATEDEFDQTIAPTLDQYLFDSSFSEGTHDVIAQALADGKLSYAEYTNIKNYYLNALNISGEVFDSALDYIIRKDIINYLRDNQDKEVDLGDFKPSTKTIQDALEESIQKAIIRSLANDIVRMRTESDFSEYTFRTLKTEAQKTSDDAEKT